MGIIPEPLLFRSSPSDDTKTGGMQGKELH
jgi:hypothetical protein